MSSNLWLNPALRGGSSVPEREKASGTAIVASPLPSHADARGAAGAHAARSDQTHDAVDWIGTSRRDEWHRLWLRVAAALLLAGSAAFSYLAWSDPAFAGATYTLSTASADIQRTWVQTNRAAQPAAARDERAATAADSDAVAATRSQVIALRQQNADLHQRLAELRARLDEGRAQAPRAPGD